jgi:hypothetical protein
MEFASQTPAGIDAYIMAFFGLIVILYLLEKNCTNTYTGKEGAGWLYF